MIRDAVPSDVTRILELVRALADYEREPDEVETTAADLERVLFPVEDHPTAYALVVEVDGTVVGIAVWFLTFSTWTGRNGIWLEDLFVDPEHRGAGHGRALIARLAAICGERGYRRLEWKVLDWNEPSIGFYRSIGAVAEEGWSSMRLTGDALAQAQL